MNKEMLLDNWAIEGHNVDDFKQALNEISSITKPEVVKANKITLYSKDRYKDDDDKNMFVYFLSPENLWNLTDTTHPSLRGGKFDKQKFIDIEADELLKEYNAITKLMVHIEGATYFTSSNLAFTLGMRTGMSGRACTHPSLERDILTAHQLKNAGDVTLITRKVNSLRKVFAVLSGKYTYVPQSFLGTVIDRITSDFKFGQTVCHSWHIDNEIAYIDIEFPDKAEEISKAYHFDEEIIPGLRLAKSDVGECSISISSTFRIKDSTSVFKTLKKQHRGAIDLDAILTEAEALAYDEYMTVPEKLAKLLTLDITNPEWGSQLKFEDFCKKNASAIKSAVKFVFKEIGIVSSIGKKREMLLFDTITEEFNPSLAFTAFDIVTTVMGLPARIQGLSKIYNDRLAIACGKAPYVDFSNFNPEKNAEETEKSTITVSL